MLKMFKTFVFGALLSLTQLALAFPPTVSCGSYRVAPPETCNAFRQAFNNDGYPVGGIAAMNNIVDQQQNINQQYQQQMQQQQYFQQMQQQQQMQQMMASQAIRVPMGQQAPQGYCSWGGRTENIAIAGVLGAVMGVIAGDNRESARKGAALGMLAGVFIPCNSLQQQAFAQQQPQQVIGQQQVSSQQNPCADQGRIAVYAPNGQVACKLPNTQAQPGERAYP